jgi:hypothetical protein
MLAKGQSREEGWCCFSEVVNGGLRGFQLFYLQLRQARFRPDTVDLTMTTGEGVVTSGMNHWRLSSVNITQGSEKVHAMPNASQCSSPLLVSLTYGSSLVGIEA